MEANYFSSELENKDKEEMLPNPRSETIYVSEPHATDSKTVVAVMLFTSSLPWLFSFFFGNLKVFEKQHCASENVQSPWKQKLFIKDDNDLNFL